MSFVNTKFVNMKSLGAFAVVQENKYPIKTLIKPCTGFAWRTGDSS